MDGRARCVNDDDSLKATELTLGLPGGDAPRSNKRSLQDAEEESPASSENGQETAPAAKAQVVGWPPIRSYRKNNFHASKTGADATRLYVKASMDGAPYLRKIDLKVYKGYRELRDALDGMFKCFSGMDASNDSQFTVTFEDRDGDLMMVGDVPWEMFTVSCKRLRIMRGSEARGLGATP
ncbi:auxin-induced protein 22D-like [Typha angustifolia]|uniref:auxin-induced protein 22D-like n=1 Tax=Typha angustifolia TaxID=59011 RepID=UPI003C2F0328